MYKLLYDTDIRVESLHFKNREYVVYRYTRPDDPLIIQLYKKVVNDMFCYVIVVNGNLVKNLTGNTVMWIKIQEAQKDIIDIFKGQFPSRCIGIRKFEEDKEKC